MYVYMYVCLNVAGDINCRLMNFCAVESDVYLSKRHRRYCCGSTATMVRRKTSQCYVRSTFLILLFITRGNSCEKKTGLEKLKFTSSLKPNFVLRLQNDLIC
jgi:hypothetical protein